jgi:hypothetical protein
MIRAGREKKGKCTIGSVSVARAGRRLKEGKNGYW